MKPKPENWTKKCEWCDKPYRVRVEWQKYCGTPCRLAAWAKRQGDKK